MSKPDPQTTISSEEIKAYNDGFEAGRNTERKHNGEVVCEFWRTFFRRDWTLEDIDALLLRVKEGDKP